MNKSYPFKFLDSYGKEDANIFFGRDEEIAALYELVFQSSVVLVYGGSGTGKTSLINCGLAGKFQTHDWLPLMIRRGSNINDSLKKTLEAQGGIIESTEDINWADDFRSEFDDDHISLSPIGNALRTIYQNSFRPIYLIFDQFEELYILGTKDEQKEFISTIRDILESQQPVKMIFSIREEYLGYLFDFEQAIPQLMKNNLRVEAMNLSKIKEVILGAIHYEGSNVSIQAGEADQIALGIFEKIRGDSNSLTIQLPFLQVFLDKFYRTITGDQSRQAEALFTVKALEEMGEIGDVLVDFLNEQVSIIAEDLGSKHSGINEEIIWKILSPFTTLEGTKDPIRSEELYGRLPELDQRLIDDTVSAFVESRILRYNEENKVFEVAHDSLAKPISEKRTVEEKNLLEIRRMIGSQANVKTEARELFTERQLLFISPHLGKLELKPNEIELIDESRTSLRKQKRKKRLRYVVSFAAMTVAFLIMLFQAINLRIGKNRQEGMLAELQSSKGELLENQANLEKTNMALAKKQHALEQSNRRMIAETERAHEKEEEAIEAQKRAENAEKESNEAKENLEKMNSTMLKFQDTMRIMAGKSKDVISIYRLGAPTAAEVQQRTQMENEIIDFANSLRQLEPYKHEYYGWGYKDGKGGIAIFPRFAEAGPFKNGLARVKPMGDDTYFIINTKGEIVSVWQDQSDFAWEETSYREELPANAFVGGHRLSGVDTINYYVCRAMYRGAKHIGRTEGKGDSCHLGWGGGERIIPDYDILTSPYDVECKWVPKDLVKRHESKNWKKVAGGWNDRGGIPLYVGRAFYKGQVMPGKIWERYSNCYVVYNGKEIEMKKYSYLMVPKKK